MYSLLRVSLYISVIKQENQIYVAYSRPNDWTDWGIYLAKKTKILFYYFFIPRATPGSSASSLHSREFNHPQQAILGIFQLWRGGGGVMINKYSPHPGKHLVPSLNMFWNSFFFQSLFYRYLINKLTLIEGMGREIVPSN